MVYSSKFRQSPTIQNHTTHNHDTTDPCTHSTTSLPATNSPSQLKLIWNHVYPFFQSIFRYFIICLTYFPIIFVHALTIWALWVLSTLHFKPSYIAWISVPIFFILIWSYHVAVFTDPGSPYSSPPKIPKSSDYTLLPIHLKPRYSSDPLAQDTPQKPGNSHDFVGPLTVKSSGMIRFCKKCQIPKPDRAHHCRTCGKCILKMDHHCPWLATCVGLRNYKAFILFLIYTSLYCYICFAVSIHWIWWNIIHDSGYLNTLIPVNVILLCILSGVIGIVLTAFTGWHIYLCARGQTTIESLEQTKYASVIKSLKKYPNQSINKGELTLLSPSTNLLSSDNAMILSHGDNISSSSITPSDYQNICNSSSLNLQSDPYQNGESQPQSSGLHTNHLTSSSYPSVDSLNNCVTLSTSSISVLDQSVALASTSPRQLSQRLNSTYINPHYQYEKQQHQQEVDRYLMYLDEKDSAQLPNAFDLGWKKNLENVFGSSKLYWFVPINTCHHDGWQWQISEKWYRERDRLAQLRASSPPPY